MVSQGRRVTLIFSPGSSGKIVGGQCAREPGVATRGGAHGSNSDVNKRVNRTSWGINESEISHQLPSLVALEKEEWNDRSN